jgi:hypothetical protein
MVAVKVKQREEEKKPSRPPGIIAIRPNPTIATTARALDRRSGAAA